MSKKAAENFLQKVLAEKEIQEKLQGLGDPREEPEKIYDAVRKVASEYGFEFTNDEWKEVTDAYAEKISKEAQAKPGELTEEQLESVAGGVVYDCTWTSDPCVAYL